MLLLIAIFATLQFTLVKTQRHFYIYSIINFFGSLILGIVLYPFSLLIFSDTRDLDVGNEILRLLFQLPVYAILTIILIYFFKKK